MRGVAAQGTATTTAGRIYKDDGSYYETSGTTQARYQDGRLYGAPTAGNICRTNDDFTGGSEWGTYGATRADATDPVGGTDATLVTSVAGGFLSHISYYVNNAGTAYNTVTFLFKPGAHVSIGDTVVVQDSVVASAVYVTITSLDWEIYTAYVGASSAAILFGIAIVGGTTDLPAGTSGTFAFLSAYNIASTIGSPLPTRNSAAATTSFAGDYVTFGADALPVDLTAIGSATWSIAFEFKTGWTDTNARQIFDVAGITEMSCKASDDGTVTVKFGGLTKTGAGNAQGINQVLITFSYSNPNGTLTLWLNGVLIGTTVGVSATVGTATALYFLRPNGSNTLQPMGWVGGWKVWNTELTTWQQAYG